MKRTSFSTLTLVLVLAGCGGRYLDLELDQGGVSASGGAASTGGSASGSGGKTSGSGGGNPEDGIGGRSQTALTRGGFAPAMATVRDGKREEGTSDESCEGGSFFVYEADQCLAASACVEACDPTDTLEIIISYRPEKGEKPLQERQAECRTIASSQDGRQGSSFFVFPCDENAECPPELVCVESELGPACFVRDVPWAAGCTEAYCIREDGPRPPASESEKCDEDVHCCPGRVCSSDGTCAPAECLEVSGPCEEPGPGPDCCPGLVCKEGSCEAP